MSSKVLLDNISFCNNPAPFNDHLQLQITFTALDVIPGMLEWKIIYVGSAKDETYDQILEEFQIGPITQQSTMKFSVDCAAPNFLNIPRDQLISVTALIITISYLKQEFIRVGYYVHNTLTEELPEEERSIASLEQLVTHAKRTVLIDKPRITKFRINWGDMKEETNNANMKLQSPINSNSSLLGRKMHAHHVQNEEEPSVHEEKQSTRQQKDQNSHSLMKSEFANAEYSHQAQI